MTPNDSDPPHPMTTREEQLQRRYYSASADAYDAARTEDDAEHTRALAHIAGVVDRLGVRSILDVGAGTGRGMRYFQEHRPTVEAWGVEPVPELIQVAVKRHGVAPERILEGSGASLPFGDSSVDVVMALAVMHHVPRPEVIVSEMLRVARCAIFISDTNRFGRGRLSSRLFKLALYNMRLWPAFYKVRTGGQGYHMSEGDGLAYSYSVYDSLRQVEEWADEVQALATTALPAQQPTGRQFHPLLTSPSVLLCALRDES